MAGHTADGCSLDALDPSLYTGMLADPDCGVGTENIGCGFTAPASDTSSYGDGFNAVGGGVYAVLWDSEYLRVWHFARGEVPDDVEAKEPEPEGWGLPQGVFGGRGCDVDGFFRDMSIVINIVSLVLIEMVLEGGGCVLERGLAWEAQGLTV